MESLRFLVLVLLLVLGILFPLSFCLNSFMVHCLVVIAELVLGFEIGES